jgi:UDP-glucose-4-epimerase GalE
LADNTVLVTGGAGFVGSHICKSLARAGYIPVVYDDLSNGHPDAVRWGPLEVGDIRDATRLREALEKHSPAAVIHLAALIEAGESVRRPEQFYRTNVLGTLCLLSEMRSAGIRKLVFSSTAAVYGTPSTLPLREGDPLSPVNPYGHTKLAAERMLHDFGAAYGLRYCALRYFNAAGADPEGDLRERHDPETHLVPLAIAAAISNGPGLRVFGTDYQTPDGTCIRDFVHVSDLAEGHLCALRRLNGGGQSIAANLGTGTGHSVLEVMRAVEKSLGKRIRATFADRRPGDPAVLVADAGLARSELGWIARYPEIQTQVAHAVASMENARHVTQAIPLEQASDAGDRQA